MTRKHFVAMAAAIKDARNVHNSKVAQAAIDDTVDELMQVFRSANPNFDTARFKAAAGLGS